MEKRQARRRVSLQCLWDDFISFILFHYVPNTAEPPAKNVKIVGRVIVNSNRIANQSGR